MFKNNLTVYHIKDTKKEIKNKIENCENIILTKDHLAVHSIIQLQLFCVLPDCMAEFLFEPLNCIGE